MSVAAVTGQVDMEDIRDVVLSQDLGQQILYLASLGYQGHLWIRIRTSGNLRGGGGGRAQKITGLVVCTDEGLEVEEEGLVNVNCLEHFSVERREERQHVVTSQFSSCFPVVLQGATHSSVWGRLASNSLRVTHFIQPGPGWKFILTRS